MAEKNQICKCSLCKKTLLLEKNKYCSPINYRYYCFGCYVETHENCKHCGDVFIVYDKHGGYCEICQHKIFEDKILLDYECKPTPVFFKKNNLNNDNMFFGVELELEGEDRFGFLKQNKNDFFYFKRDCSLDSTQGVEIVSHPANLDYHLKSGAWDKMFEDIIQHQMKNKISCGLHFHVNRLCLDRKTIARLDYVINTYNVYIESWCGRKFNRYAKKQIKYNDEWGVSSTTRSSAFNLRNENTVEFRFCSSTNVKRIFFERLISIYALVNYCKNYKDKDMIYISKEEFVKEFDEYRLDLINKLK